MPVKYLQILLLLSVAFGAFAQTKTDSVSYSLNTRLAVGNGTYASFLSTANQYDRYSFAPNALTLWGTAHKNTDRLKKIDYGFGVELDGNCSKTDKRFFPNELYLQGKVYFLNVYAGQKRQVFGNQDPELSSGGMLWSQNSRPMPKISIESDGYLPIPYTRGYAEVKGGLSHGWFENQKDLRGLLLHHKYAYIRLGGSFPVNLSYGVQHVAQWGGRSNALGSMPVTLDNYLRIFIGSAGGSTASWSDRENALGNHIVSQNLGLDVNLKSANISLYWQSIAEDAPVKKFITKTPTVEDGLWGASVKIPGFRLLHHFVLEYISTTDQSGPWHDLDGVIFGGLDGYYGGAYPNGWSYRGMTIGNPWLTSPKYNEDGYTSIMNNTIRLYYFSGEGKIKLVNYRITLAKSKNYGHTRAIYEDYKKQFSWQIEGSMPLYVLKNTKIIMGYSRDKGEMYGNNSTFFIGLSVYGLTTY